MKVFAIVSLLLFANLAGATQRDQSFQRFMDRHEEMVSNDGDVFLLANITRHQHYAELSEVVSSLTRNYTGMEGLEVEEVAESEKNKNVLNGLLGSGFTPYFCGALDENWDDVDLCRSHTEKLLGDVLEGADSVYMLQAYGNHYGDWAEVVLIVQNYDTNESLVIAFDIIHEI